MTGTALKWFDFALKGVRNEYATEPPVRIFIAGENVWRAGVNNSTGVPDADLDFWGNTVGPAARWLNLGTGAAQLEGLASDRNLFVGAAEDAANFYLDGKSATLRDWR